MEQLHLDRLKAIIDRIKDNPACWNQEEFHCGTAHCIAGHAQMDMRGTTVAEVGCLGIWVRYGRELQYAGATTDGADWLGLSIDQKSYLFHMSRTLQEIEEFHASEGKIPVLA